MKEIKSCDLCGNMTFDVVRSPHPHQTFVTSSGTLVLTIGAKLCKNCGFVFLSPRMDEKELNAYYATQSRYTRSFEQLEKSPYDQLCRMQIELIKRFCGDSINHILEIGSAEGYFLHLFSREGVLVEGIEPAAAYKNFSAKNFPKVKMHWTMIEDAKLTEGDFSLCVMRHVLEHFESPVDILKLVHKLLINEGYLYVEVPNLSRAHAATYDYFHAEHLSYFTPQTISYLCRLTGFSCRIVEEWDDNPLDSGLNYPVLRVIAQKDSSVKNRDLSCPDFTFSKTAISDYFRRRESFFLKYIRPLESKITDWHNAGKKIALFGGGPHTADLLQVLRVPDQSFICAFDNDSLKWGKTVGKIPIVSPGEVSNYKPQIVIVSSRELENEIARSLKSWDESGIQIVKIYNP